MMRRNSAAFRELEAAASELFAGSGRVLFVGAAASEKMDSVSVPDLGAAGGALGGWSGAVWVVDSELGAGITALRGQLQPGAQLLLVLALGGRLLKRARELVGGRALPVYSREQVCEAALTAGLLAPGVWLETSRLLAVRAALPTRPDPLDAFFTQPLRA